jgi:hypothetical protein
MTAGVRHPASERVCNSIAVNLSRIPMKRWNEKFLSNSCSILVSIIPASPGAGCSRGSSLCPGVPPSRRVDLQLPFLSMLPMKDRALPFPAAMPPQFSCLPHCTDCNGCIRIMRNRFGNQMQKRNHSLPCSNMTDLPLLN